MFPGSVVWRVLIWLLAIFHNIILHWYLVNDNAIFHNKPTCWILIGLCHHLSKMYKMYWYTNLSNLSLAVDICCGTYLNDFNRTLLIWTLFICTIEYMQFRFSLFLTWLQMSLMSERPLQYLKKPSQSSRMKLKLISKFDKNAFKHHWKPWWSFLLCYLLGSCFTSCIIQLGLVSTKEHVTYIL